MAVKRKTADGGGDGVTGQERVRVSFAALSPWVEVNIIEPEEIRSRGKDWILWGRSNDYPEYLWKLYSNVTTLRSVINGSVDYVCGNGVELSPLVAAVHGRGLVGAERGVLNRKGETVSDVVRFCAQDYFIYGGFALQVISTRAGDGIAEIYNVPLRYLRSNREGEVFYYSEHWAERWSRPADGVTVYPSFLTDGDGAPGGRPGRHYAPSSIVWVKTQPTMTYPAPLYAGDGVKACEIERCITDYHLSAINNGFVGSYMVNFNNGVPPDDVKEEIEQTFTEKFAGHGNAGRIGFSWNPNTASRTTFEKMEIQDYGEKYKTLAERSRQEIFTAFRANPNLFGIPTESLGFSSEEYASAFALYNRTQIRPVQELIVRTFDKIFGTQGAITIRPFTLTDEQTTAETGTNTETNRNEQHNNNID